MLPAAALTIANKINWKWVFIVLGIALLLFVIWFQGRKTGLLGKAKVIDVPKDVFHGGNVLIDGSKVNRIATQLHDDMKGANMLGHEDEYYIEFSNLSDSEFTSVYNNFNERFNREGEGTLKDWIMNETFGGWTIIDDVILPKMARLNLN